MTSTDTSPRFAALVLLCCAILFLGNIGNLADPLIWSDDYPALRGHSEGYWTKTLAEGRWGTYWWHLRPILTPAWLNYAVYLACWAYFSACIADMALVRYDTTRRIFFGYGSVTIAVAVLLAANTQIAMLSRWSNTLLPAVATLALYAGIARTQSLGHSLFVLPFAVLASFLFYTTFTFVALIPAILARRVWSVRLVCVYAAVFMVGFIAALLCVYGLNWHFHGVFGVQPADWRSATPAGSFADFIGNGHLFADTLDSSLTAAGSVLKFAVLPSLVTPVVSLLFLAALARCWRYSPMFALAWSLPLGLGLGFVVLQTMVLGVAMPERSMVFFAATIAIFLGYAACVRPETRPAKYLRLATVALAACQAVYVPLAQIPNQAWRTETKHLAADLDGVREPVFIHFVGLPDFVFLLHKSVVTDGGLAARLEFLTNLDVVDCDALPDACPPRTETSEVTTRAVWDYSITQRASGTDLVIYGRSAE